MTELKLEGNRLTFVGTGKRGWSVHPAGGQTEHHCCPRLVFDGRMDGDLMTLTMTLTSTERPVDPAALPLQMEAKRLR